MMIRPAALALLTLFSVSFAASLPAAEPLPVVHTDNFEEGVKQWSPTDPEAWKVTESDGNHVYSQFKKKSNYNPPHRSPFNISLLQDVNVGDFDLTVKVLSTHPDYGHRDACLFFGYQDPAHFYYVHLGKKADDHANQIFIVNEAARNKISEKSTDGTDWDDNWHTLRIKRRVETGLIEIFYDNMEEPVMVSHDKTFVWGRVGLGSFDDTTAWDEFELRGVKVTPPASK
ncbi:hypothetical protein [Lignipirellula cremea]|uniref:Uncharacterized protein n=1 Tax=Lignipirellula cremea TaxID=2528010 RepID=A0A518E1V5_9BACT|nr:hypothetical protein [Lignipirellula cremea]QDU98052.1 hypothetical protein Pla8534_59130 [Lignipirellula cremea]